MNNTYSPNWPGLPGGQVVGRYEDRVIDSETGMPEPQKFEVTCSVCGMVWKGTCTSGMVKNQITRFGLGHTHGDPFKRPVTAR